MPAIAAHYQYSKLVAENFTTELSTLVNRHKNYFLLGAQGPDLLFYHKPLTKNSISTMGHDLHTLSGETFFSKFFSLNFSETDKSIAYLLGVCCHYGLDRESHPYIDNISKIDSHAHANLESDFDSYVIKKYNMSKSRQKYVPKINDFRAIADVYLLSEKNIKDCHDSFKFFSFLLNHRKLIYYAEKLIKSNGKFHALTLKDDYDYPDECEILFEIFINSIERTAKFAEIFYEAITSKNHLLYDCAENFEGIVTKI